MTLYEELGVPQDAPLDAIHEAYRNVARLLHPDAQTNPVLKKSAEVQMKRINYLYEVLADPASRRRYDAELAGVEDRPEPLIIQAPRHPREFSNGQRGTIVWLAATAIGIAFIIWLATRESSAPAVYPEPVSEAGGGSVTSSALQRAAAKILPNAILERQRNDEIARLRADLAAANSDRERLLRQVAELEGERRTATAIPQSPARLTPPPLAAQSMPSEVALPLPGASPTMPPVPAAVAQSVSHGEPATPASEARRPKWAGAWTYRAARKESGNSAVFPPEFIETLISEENGRIRGQYHARFRVAGANVAPNVDFRFEGSVSGTSGHFFWKGNGGAKGEVKLRLISDSSLEVVWEASSLGKSMGLASGAAVLDRKN